jgi:hypothetical protein
MISPPPLDALLRHAKRARLSISVERVPGTTVSTWIATRGLARVEFGFSPAELLHRLTARAALEVS